MAKIGNLQVESIHVVGGAVTASAVATGVGMPQTVTAVNGEVKPVQVFWNVRFFYSSTVGDGSGTYTFKVERVRSSLVIWSGTVSDSGFTGGAQRFHQRAGSWIDMAAQANDEYRIVMVSVTAGGGPPAASLGTTSVKIAAMWVKR